MDCDVLQVEHFLSFVGMNDWDGREPSHSAAHSKRDACSLLFGGVCVYVCVLLSKGII